MKLSAGQESVEFERTAAVVAQRLFGASVETTPVKVGRFEVGTRLGRGGMGTVYEAVDPRLDRKVALKVVRRFRAGLDLAPELDAEAAAAASVDHPNVVKIYELGRDGDRNFIVMELITGGQTLGQWCDAERERDRRPSWQTIVPLFAQAARGLAAVHKAGFVHGDFKPSNVLLSEVDGKMVARVADFGLARVTGIGSVRSSSAGGTVTYCAPEQLRGDSEIGPAADQYAFFVALFEALGGQPLSPDPDSSRRDWLEKRQRVLEQRRPLSAPRWLRNAIQRGTRDDPDARHPTMDVVAELLERTPVSRRVAWFAGALATTVGLGLAVPFAVTTPPGPDCGTADDAWTETWSSHREEISNTYRQRPNLLGEGGVERLDAAITRWGARWSRARREVCTTAMSASPDLAPDFAAKRRCLEVQLFETRALLEKLGSPLLEDAQRARALEVVAKLPLPKACLSVDARGSETPSIDPEERRLRAVLAEAKVAMYFLENERAVALIAAEEAALKHLGRASLSGEALLRSSMAKERLGDREDARAGFTDALTLGIRERQPALAASAARQLMWLDGYRNMEIERAMDWNKLAEAWEAQGNLDAGTRALRLDTLGTTLMRGDDYDRSIEVHREAIALAEQYWGRDDARLIGFWVNANMPALLKEDLELAAEFNRRAEELIEVNFGSEHPFMAKVLVNRPFEWTKEGCKSNLAAYERAIAIYERVHGENPFAAATAVGNLGGCLLEMGEYESAIVQLERQVQIVTSKLGAEHPALADAYINLGIAHDALGNWDEALRFGRKSLSVTPETQDKLLAARQARFEDFKAHTRAAESGK